MSRTAIFLCVALLLLALPPGPCPAAVNVATVAELVSAVNAANSGADPDIRVQPGYHALAGAFLRISRDGVSVRGEGGDRDAVVLDGGYQTTEIFQIVASSVTVADMCLQRALDHPVHVVPSGASPTGAVVLENLHIIDPGQQAIKINANDQGVMVTSGLISGCLIELTGTGRPYIRDNCYTGGIDGNTTSGWTVADNTVRGFWCADGLSEHGIHFWNGSVGTVVERNRIQDCDRGIGFGLGARGHSGGIIRNNTVWQGQAHPYSDVGISLESAPGARVYNNTVFLDNGYPNAIEYRFAATSAASGVLLANNLVNRAITARDGATAETGANVEGALASWFRDAAAGDLHLAWAVSGVVDAGLAVEGLGDDMDCGPRPAGAGMDIGADEYASGGEVPAVTVPPLLHPLLGT